MNQVPINAKIFFTIEVMYLQDNEVKMFHLRNFIPKKLMEFREKVFTTGVYRVINEEEGEIISPYNIKSILVTKQEKFFTG